MKKKLLLIMVLTLTMAVMTACGGNGAGGSGSSDDVSVDSLKTIGDVIALEAEETQFAVYEDVVVYVFKLGDAYYRATAAISPEDSQKYFDISYEDEDYEQQQKDIISPLEISEIEDLSDQILSQEERDALGGKTGQELMDDGWTFTGHDLESMEFWMNKGLFCYTVVFDGEVAEADYESFVDEEGTKEMTVKSVEVNGLSDAATEIETK